MEFETQLITSQMLKTPSKRPSRKNEWTAKLARIEDNFDGEGAIKPSQDAIEQTERILQWLESYQQIAISDASPDVLGGVGIDLDGRGQNKAWIAIMNGGWNTYLIYDDNGFQGCHLFSEFPPSSLIDFLSK